MEFIPYSTHQTALAHQLGADALLLVSEGYVTAKAYEYLGAGRPIICLTEGEELRRLVAETGAGRSFGPDDLQEMKGYLMELFNREKPDKSSRIEVPDSIIPYTRKAQAGELAALIEEVIG